MKAKPYIERFWEKVKKTNKCWHWTGSKRPDGYGQLSIGNYPARAHRISWKIHFGNIPKGLDVCHHCDNPSCIRPDHLFLGTRKDNMKDMVRKGRHCSITHPERIARGKRHGSTTHPESIPRGSKHWARQHPEWLLRGEQKVNAILSEPDVRSIHEQHLLGFGNRTIAKQFGVARTTITWIIKGQNWKHIWNEFHTTAIP